MWTTVVCGSVYFSSFFSKMSKKLFIKLKKKKKKQFYTWMQADPIARQLYPRVSCIHYNFNFIRSPVSQSRISLSPDPER
jgi:hypothetical protein